MKASNGEVESAAEDLLDLGQRIAEILAELQITPIDMFRQISPNIQMQKSTFYDCLNGRRWIKPSELAVFSEFLQVPISRVKQEDTRKQLTELGAIFAHLTAPDKTPSNVKPHPKKALQLAIELNEVAIGASERCRALTDLGKAYYLVQQYDDAHDAWLKALDFARRSLEKKDDTDILMRIMNNLMITYTIRKEYSGAKEMLAIVEPYLKGDMRKLGILFYTRADIEEHSGNLAEAKRQAYKSLEAFRATGNLRWIGKAEITAAYYEYKTRRFKATLELLQSAIQHLDGSEYFQVVAKKDYAKTLLKLKKFSTAKETLLEILETHSDTLVEYPVLKHKVSLLRSVATADYTHSESVLLNAQASDACRMIAFKILRRDCIRTGDDSRLMQYSKIAEELTINSADVLDEEEL